jgi:AcrR family transcriptional regulator
MLDLLAEKFFREGFFKTSMDEIAADLHISKKTIYKYFPSKEELLDALIKNYLIKSRTDIDLIINSGQHAVHKVVNIINTIKKICMHFSEKWLRDIRIYHPSIWKTIEEFRLKMIANNFSKIFSQGIKEGYIIDIPPQIALTVFISSIRAIINPEFILDNSFSVKEAIDHTFKILFNGIFTDKGRKVLKHLTNQKERVKQ